MAAESYDQVRNEISALRTVSATAHFSSMSFLGLSLLWIFCDSCLNSYAKSRHGACQYLSSDTLIILQAIRECASSASPGIGIYPSQGRILAPARTCRNCRVYASRGASAWLHGAPFPRCRLSVSFTSTVKRQARLIFSGFRLHGYPWSLSIGRPWTKEACLTWRVQVRRSAACTW